MKYAYKLVLVCLLLAGVVNSQGMTSVVLAQDAERVVFSEDFSTAGGTTPPTGWQNDVFLGDNADTGIWRFDNPSFRGVELPLDQPLAIFDSDNLGANGLAEDVALESPAIDLSTVAEVELRFDQFFSDPNATGGGATSVEVSNDNGATWQTVYTTTTTTATPDSQTIDISTEVAGASNARMRFRWQGDESGYWMVDNIQLVEQRYAVTGVTIDGPTSVSAKDENAYTAVVAPGNASQPINYTWSPTPNSGQGTATATYIWDEPVITQISVTAENTEGNASDTLGILVGSPRIDMLEEDFETASDTTPPAGWVNTDLIADAFNDAWRFDNPGGRAIEAPLSGQVAVFDSTNTSLQGGDENVVLESPAFDTAGAKQVLLDFDQRVSSAFGTNIFVEVFDGTDWQTVFTSVGTDQENEPNIPLETRTIDITEYVQNVSDAQVRFRWTGNWSGYWIVDNVRVSGIPVDAPLEGIEILGVSVGSIDVPYAFGIQTTPITATRPITYTWSPEPDSGQGTTVATYSWSSPGLKEIRLTADNGSGVAETRTTIGINPSGAELLFEDFSGASGTTPPTSWENRSLRGEAPDDLWRFDNPGDRDLTPPIVGPAAIFDSEAISNNRQEENAVLVSRRFSVVGLTGVQLEFHQYFDSEFGGEAFVEVSADDGLTWQQVYRANTDSANPDFQQINISNELAGATNARVRFRWTGNFSQYWIVDNVRVVVPVDPVPVESVTITGPEFGSVNEEIVYTAVVSPEDTTFPITYTWTPEPDSGQGTAQATYIWDTSAVRDISVTADNGAGSAQDQTTVTIFPAREDLLVEDFSTASGSTPPAGWSNVIIQGFDGVDLWRYDNPGERTLNAPITSPAAIFDSDYLGVTHPETRGNEEVALTSPPFDASETVEVLLEFDQFFDSEFGGEIFVDVFDGTVWQNVYGATATTANPDQQSIDVSDHLVGVANAQIRFRWTGNFSRYWIVDNVRVSSVSSNIPVPIESIVIAGPATGAGEIGVSYPFTATISPNDATTPITYTWTPEPDSGQGTASAVYSFDTAGSYTIRVIAQNAGGSETSSTTIDIEDNVTAVDSVSITGPQRVLADDTISYNFEAQAMPNNATTPIAYTWAPEPTSGQGTATASYSFTSPGTITISVTATNAGGSAIGEFPVTVEVCPDTFEPNNRSADATPFTVGNTQTHYFCTGSDQDWLSFVATADTTYRIETSNLATGVDTSLRLYDTDGLTLIVANDDSSEPGAGNESLIVERLLDAGTYYVRVVNANASGSVDFNYDVQITTVTDVPVQGVNIDGATEVDANTTTVYTATVEPDSATAPVNYAWSPTPDSGQGTATASYIFTSAGTQVVSVTASNAFGSDVSQISINVSENVQAVTGVTINGDTSGTTGSPVSLTAAFSPANATTPISYTWSPEPTSGQGTASASYTFGTAGTYPISVTASNAGGSATADATLTIEDVTDVPLESVTIAGDNPRTVTVGSQVEFSASVSPANATTPIDYTWSGIPDSGHGTASATYTFNSTGTFTVEVTAENAGGTGSASASVTVIVEEDIVAVQGVTIIEESDTVTVTVGTSRQFSASVRPGSATNPTYTWSGTPDSGQNTSSATYTFNMTGTFTIEVTAQNAGGTASDSITVVVIDDNEVVAVDGVTIAGSDTRTVVVSSSIQLTASVSPANATTPISYTWSGTPDSGSDTPNATYTFNSTGTYTIEVTAQNAGGTASDSVTIQVIDDNEVVAVEGVTIAGADPRSVVVGSPIQLAAGVSPANATMPISYTWSGTPDSGSDTPNATYTFNLTGTFTVTVTAENEGGTASDSVTIQVIDESDVVAVEDVGISGPATMVVGTQSTFDAIVSPTDATEPITYTWTPTPDSGQNTASAAYTFDMTGTYTISLTAGNLLGSDTTTTTVNVIGADEVIAINSVTLIGPNSGLVGETLSFQADIAPANATNPTYEWFPDPASGQGTANATYTFDTAGEQRVLVTVANAGGRASDFVDVTVTTEDGGPVERVEIVGPTSGVPGVRYNFTANVTPNNASDVTYVWTPEPTSGQGNFRAGYTFASLGTQTVTVTVSNEGGSASDSASIQINPPAMTFQSSVMTASLQSNVYFTATVNPLVNPFDHMAFDFGDGSEVVLSERTTNPFTATHAYSSTGTYTATATFVASQYGGAIVSETLTINVGGEPGVPATIQLLANDTSIPADGSSTTAITAIVRDGNGDTLPGVTVTLRTNLGAFVGVTVTDVFTGTTSDIGLFTVDLQSSSTPGTATVRGTVDGFAGIQGSVQVVFSSDAPPASVSVTAQPGSIPADGSSTSTITATVRDADSNPLADQTVAFSTTLGTFGGETTATATTDSSGRAVVTLTSAASAGTAEVVARAGDVSGSAQVTFTSTTPGAPASVDISVTSRALTVDDSITVRATVRDSQGDPVASQAVTWETSPGSFSGGSQSVTVNTDSSGEVAVSLTADTVGLIILRATAGSANDVTSILVNPVGESTVEPIGEPSVVNLSGSDATTVDLPGGDDSNFDTGSRFVVPAGVASGAASFVLQEIAAPSQNSAGLLGPTSSRTRASVGAFIMLLLDADGNVLSSGSLDAPIVATLVYKTVPSGFSEGTLTLYRYDEGTSTWGTGDISQQSLSAETNTGEWNISHASEFAIAVDVDGGGGGSTTVYLPFIAR